MRVVVERVEWVWVQRALVLDLHLHEPHLEKGSEVEVDRVLVGLELVPPRVEGQHEIQGLVHGCPHRAHENHEPDDGRFRARVEAEGKVQLGVVHGEAEAREHGQEVQI